MRWRRFSRRPEKVVDGQQIEQIWAALEQAEARLEEQRSWLGHLHGDEREDLLESLRRQEQLIEEARNDLAAVEKHSFAADVLRGLDEL